MKVYDFLNDLSKRMGEQRTVHEKLVSPADPEELAKYTSHLQEFANEKVGEVQEFLKGEESELPYGLKREILSEVLAVFFVEYGVRNAQRNSKVPQKAVGEFYDKFCGHLKMLILRDLGPS